MVDGTKAANKDPKTALTATSCRAEEPARRERQPGRQVLHLRRQALAHRHGHRTRQGAGLVRRQAGRARQGIVAEVESAWAPAHRLRRPRQRHTTLFLDSQVVKWNVGRRSRSTKGDKNAKYVVDRIDVHYQPATSTPRSETKAADGGSWPWAASSRRTASCRWARCTRERQIIDISGEKMVLLADHPVRGEPHDFIIFKRDLGQAQTGLRWTSRRWPSRTRRNRGVFRNGKKVTVKLTSQAPAFSLREFKVKKGDEVTLILTNLDKVEGPDARLRDPEVQHQLRREPAGDEVGHLPADQPGRVLVLLLALLPRAAPGDAYAHDRRGLTPRCRWPRPRGCIDRAAGGASNRACTLRQFSHVVRAFCAAPL